MVLMVGRYECPHDVLLLSCMRRDGDVRCGGLHEGWGGVPHTPGVANVGMDAGNEGKVGAFRKLRAGFMHKIR